MVGRWFAVVSAFGVAGFAAASYPSSLVSDCLCPPVRPVTIFACPTPAPPSPGPTTFSTNEPPVGKKGTRPIIDQYRTFGGVPQTTEPRTPTARVSFWNLTGFDVTLTVNDRTQPLAKDRAVIVDVNRNFTWRINNETPKSEDVPDDLNHFEVLVK